MEKYKLEKVTWLDSSMVSAGWKYTENNLKDQKKYIALRAYIHSVGWVIYEDKKQVVICSNIGDEANTQKSFEFSFVTRIPKGGIKKRKRIKL